MARGQSAVKATGAQVAGRLGWSSEDWSELMLAVGPRWSTHPFLSGTRELSGWQSKLLPGLSQPQEAWSILEFLH